MATETWYLMQSGLGDPAFNMAMDEALLGAAAALNCPVLRFYGWTEPAATFGYFQKFAEVGTWTRLRPLIRRPTGGGLVPHDADWTYSLVFPPNHPWYRLKAVDSYRAVHDWLRRAFAALGVTSHLAPGPRKTAPGQCFAGPEMFDLLLNGVKIAGAAQRRTRAGLLIQGSVQPRASSVARRQWESAMLETAPPPGAILWRALSSNSLRRTAEDLANAKYSQSAYNQKR